MNLLAPWFLVGLAGFALPWMLHRFSRTVPPERPFPSARFLEAATPPVSRRRRLRYRALLSLRWLLLLLLCLLFAQPTWQSWLAGAGEAGVRFVALDASLSMRHDEREVRARAAAGAAIDEALAAGETVQVFEGGAAVRSLGPATRDPNAAHAALAGYRPGYARLDYGRLMQRLDVLAGEFEGPVRVTFVTDAQASAMPSRLGALIATRAASLDIVDVASADDWNHSLRAEGTRHADGTRAAVRVAIDASAAAEAPGSVRRELLIRHDGEILARREVELTRGGTRRMVFDDIALPDRTVTALEIAFADTDSLVADDVVMVPLRSTRAEPVWLLEARAGVARDATVFVETALESGGGFAAERGTVASAPPDDASVAIVFGTGELPPVVGRMVTNGGHALLVAGDGAANDERDGVEPAVRRIGRIDATHALPLAELRWSELRWYELADLPLDDDDRVLVATEDGRPVLVEVDADVSGSGMPASGAGRVLRLADPLDGRASDLPLHPDFVTLMRAIVDWFLGSKALPERLDAGARVRLPVNVEVLDTAGDAMRSLAERGEAGEIAFDTPGLYTLETPRGQERLVVRIPAAESRIDPLPAAEVGAWEARHTAAEPTGARTPQARGTPTGVETATVLGDTAYWLWAFALLLAASLLELAYANRRLDVRRDA